MPRKELARAFVSATERRNKIAHSGHTVSDVDDEIFNQVAKIICLTAKTISTHLGTQITIGTPKTAAQPATSRSISRR